jgi:hypothetical protein
VLSAQDVKEETRTQIQAVRTRLEEAFQNDEDNKISSTAGPGGLR